MTRSFHPARHGVLFLSLLAVCLTGCNPDNKEVAEAKRFAADLRALLPTSNKLIDEEHDIANELRIVLNVFGVVNPATPPGKPEPLPAKPEAPPANPEAPQAKPETLLTKLTLYVDRLTALRNARRQLLASVRQGVWQSAMVFAVQMDGVAELNYQINRTEAWLELAQNVRLRTSLNHKGDIPELPKLNHELDSYLMNSRETPILSQITSLLEEYRFSFAEIK